MIPLYLSFQPRIRVDPIRLVLDVMHRDITLSEKRDVIDVLLYERRIRVGDLVDALDQFVEVEHEHPL